MGIDAHEWEKLHQNYEENAGDGEGGGAFDAFRAIGVKVAAAGLAHGGFALVDEGGFIEGIAKVTCDLVLVVFDPRPCLVMPWLQNGWIAVKN